MLRLEVWRQGREDESIVEGKWNKEGARVVDEVDKSIAEETFFGKIDHLS
jgi:hypothetical protein